MANYSYPNPLIGKAPKNFRRAGITGISRNMRCSTTAFSCNFSKSLTERPHSSKPQLRSRVSDSGSTPILLQQYFENEVVISTNSIKVNAKYKGILIGFSFCILSNLRIASDTNGIRYGEVRCDVKVEIVNHNLILERLSTLRNAETSNKAFRQNLHDLSTFLIYEAMRNVALDKQIVETPLTSTDGWALTSSPIIVPIVRRFGHA